MAEENDIEFIKHIISIHNEDIEIVHRNEVFKPTDHCGHLGEPTDTVNLNQGCLRTSNNNIGGTTAPLGGQMMSKTSSKNVMFDVGGLSTCLGGQKTSEDAVINTGGATVRLGGQTTSKDLSSMLEGPLLAWEV